MQKYVNKQKKKSAFLWRIDKKTQNIVYSSQ